MKIAVFGARWGVAERARAQGLEPVVHTEDTKDVARCRERGIRVVDEPAEFFTLLEHPRFHFLDLDAGPEIDRVIDTACTTMEPGDVVLDTTPSWWCDTLRRYRRMRHRALYYLDLAWIDRDGRSLLTVAGDRAGADLARPMLDRLAGAGDEPGHGSPVLHLGGAGLAHYCAMVEAAVTTARTQLRAEAALMLDAWPSTIDRDRVRTLFPLVDPPPLGRAGWLVDDALRLEAAAPLLTQSAVLALSEALEEGRSRPMPMRVGAFGLPDDIL
ncbi:MAG: hypothetical protein KDE35_16635 [Geminicoccaceae bacterium]|nr:hypothetical protein [Geminicoccaceae bacterium]